MATRFKGAGKMAHDWQPFSARLHIEGSNTTQENVLHKDRYEQFEYRLRSVAFRNIDNATTSARLLIRANQVEHFLEQWTTLTANIVYSLHGVDIPIAPHEEFGIALFGITDNDTIEVYMRGLRRLVG